MSDINTEKLHIDKLKKRFRKYKTISVDDFHDFYKDVYGEIKKGTVSWYIYDLKERQIIRNVSRGQYVLEESRNVDIKEYVVITIDIIKSSELNYIKFNEELQRKVKDLNSVISQIYDCDREFFISQGDEIQILCPLNKSLSSVLFTTLCYLRPFEIRYGISFGVVEGEFKKNSWDMNGPIFWNARDCLTKLKNSSEYDGLVISEFYYADKLCNDILSLINNNIRRITDKQWAALRFELSNASLDEALKELDIAKTSYYDRLNNSNIADMMKALESIFEIMMKRRNIV